jgi:hypothetical protein
VSILYHPRPERWPQVSLRGLLVIVTLAALLTPWAIAEYRAWNEAEDYELPDHQTYVGEIGPFDPP